MLVFQDNFHLMRNTWLSYPKHDFLICWQIDRFLPRNYFIVFQLPTFLIYLATNHHPNHKNCSTNEPGGAFRMWILRIKYEMLNLCILTDHGNPFPEMPKPAFKGVSRVDHEIFRGFSDRKVEGLEFGDSFCEQHP